MNPRDPVLTAEGLSLGEDLVLKASLDNLHSQLRVTLGRLADRAINVSDAPKLLARFLRARADEYDPGPPQLDPEASVRRLTEIQEAYAQVEYDFGVAAGTAVADTVFVIRDDMAIQIEQKGTNPIDAHREACTILADNLERLAASLRGTS